MLIIPLLSERQLKELKWVGINDIDLCDNGLVVSPGQSACFDAVDGAASLHQQL